MRQRGRGRIMKVQGDRPMTLLIPRPVPVQACTGGRLFKADVSSLCIALTNVAKPLDVSTLSLKTKSWTSS